MSILNLMIFDLYAVVSNFAVKRAHNLSDPFSDSSSSYVVYIYNHYHSMNQNSRLMMGLTSRLYYVYDDFSSYCVFNYSVMSLTMMGLTPGLLVRALFYFTLEITLGVSVE